MDSVSAPASPRHSQRKSIRPVYLDDYLTDPPIGQTRSGSREENLMYSTRSSVHASSPPSPAHSNYLRGDSKDDLIKSLQETVKRQSDTNQMLAETASKQMEQLEQQNMLMSSATSLHFGSRVSTSTPAPQGDGLRPHLPAAPTVATQREV